MTKPEGVTVKEGDPEWAALREGYLDGLLEDLFFTGDHEKLRTYIEEGGDLDQEWIRNVLAKNHAKTIPGKKGGPKDVKNIRFYLDVELYLLSEQSKCPGKKQNLAAALRDVGKNNIEPGELNDRAVDRADKTYRKGKHLLCGVQFLS